MSSSDWKVPFLELRGQLKNMYDADLELYHGIVLLPNSDDFDPALIEEIEAAQDGREIVKRIVTPTHTSVYHAHHFGVSKPLRQSNWYKFAEILSGAESWIRKIPDFPKFIRHPIPDQSVRDVIAWTNLVYYLAGRLNRPYLSVMVEHYNGDLFETWKTWPKPHAVNLLPALIHEQDPITSIMKLSHDFEAEGYDLPCMIDAYLEGPPMISDLVRASSIAVDCLLYMIDGLNTETATSDKKQVRQRCTTEDVQREILLLKGLLIAAMQKQEEEGKTPEPLTQKDIALAMNWMKKVRGSVVANEVKVSRRMQAIFGPKPQERYEAAFKSTSTRKGLRTKLRDQSTTVDGIEDAEIDDLD